MRVKIHKKHRDILLTPSYPYWPSPTGRNPRFQVMRFGGNAVMRLLGRRGGLGWNCAGSLRCPYPGPTEKGQNDCAAIDLTSVFTWNARDSLGFRRKADLSFHLYRREHRHQLSFENFFPLGGKLSVDNRWIKLAELNPWDELGEDYASHFCRCFGAPATSFEWLLAL